MQVLEVLVQVLALGAYADGLMDRLKGRDCRPALLVLAAFVLWHLVEAPLLTQFA
jgi:hypothetical protein